MGIVSRFLLFVTVVAGIVGMHTIGHPDRTGHAGMVDHAVGTMSAPDAVVGVMVAAAHVDAHGGGMHMNPLNVCVAILVGGLLLLLATLLSRGRRRQTPDRHTLAALSAIVRGPPDDPLLGVRLAGLSVQRI